MTFFSVCCPVLNSLQTCPTLRDSVNSSLPGSSAHRIFRINIPNLPADSVAGLSAPLPGSNREQPGSCPHLTPSTPRQDDSKNKEGIVIVLQGNSKPTGTAFG